jgi:hypothetical protein
MYGMLRISVESALFMSRTPCQRNIPRAVADLGNITVIMTKLFNKIK